MNEDLERAARHALIEPTADLLAQGLTASDIMASMAAVLDELRGGMVSVVHVAGPGVEGNQVCVKCGATLLESGTVEVHGDDGLVASYRPTFPDGAMVWEIRRWGEPTWPHAMGVQTENPKPEEGEVWCLP